MHGRDESMTGGWIDSNSMSSREILALFVRTDGWGSSATNLGPGTPRGLDGMPKPPRARRNAA